MAKRQEFAMDLGWNDLPYPLLLVDEKQRIVVANSRAARELGRPAKALVQVTLAELLESGQPGSEARFHGQPVPVWLQSRPWTGEEPYQVLVWTPLPGTVKETSSGSGGEDAKAATILVAEDEESIRDICRRVLANAGYTVLVAPDGQTAIDLLWQRGEDIDLVLADVVMPVAGGEAIFDYVRRARLRVPVIFTSGYTPRNAPAGFLQEPGIILLRKPFTLAQLLTTVRTALANQT